MINFAILEKNGLYYVIANKGYKDKKVAVKRSFELESIIEDARKGKDRHKELEITGKRLGYEIQELKKRIDKHVK